jgi:hypothetical protein
MARCFLAVATRDNVLAAVGAGFCFVDSGKRTLLSQMSEGDWLAYYSPRELQRETTPCRRFTAIGKVAAGRVSMASGSAGLEGERRPMRYLRCYPVAAATLVRSLSFIRNPERWGVSFRAGFFEVRREDFAVIAEAMLTRVDWEAL